MLTSKILFTINSLEKKKKLFIQNTIYNSCRFKFSLERVNINNNTIIINYYYHCFIIIIIINIIIIIIIIFISLK